MAFSLEDLKAAPIPEFSEHDVSIELERRYIYPNGTFLSIPEPVTLFIRPDNKQGAAHRVVAKDGFTYRPERGWVAIAWKQRDGKAFSF